MLEREDSVGEEAECGLVSQDRRQHMGGKWWEVGTRGHCRHHPVGLDVLKWLEARGSYAYHVGKSS